ncbi:hypothetical protein Glove_134g30 [Diversispora epigaea]|uniref:Uncharacterized protein n=1 Tax=Diversispora epigaea TaxID=1348612 RepID=A0A397J5W5_9GLOM|nr:hypothetical protein Glove_134g30 [Diversispora epigaea]
MASLCRKPGLISSFRKLLSILNIIGHTERHEQRLEKQRMTKSNPIERLQKDSNIWNIGIIDNIDFKERTFKYGNIFDSTRNTSHTTLRMVSQIKMPFSLYENSENENKITSLTGFLGVNNSIKNMWNMFDEIIDEFLNFYVDNKGEIQYNSNFDMQNIHKKILEKVEYGCLGDLSNIVILESGRIPNTDEGIFQSTKMYVEDLDLNEEEYLDIWHTSKDMCSVLIVLFSSYGIFDLAKELERHEQRLEKQRMTKSNPIERLQKDSNIWNIGIIDNIDFKERTFKYGNIFDSTRNTSHTTLRMVSQIKMPFSLYENSENENKITSLTGFLGVNNSIKNMWNMFDEIIDEFLNFYVDNKGEIQYNSNFDMQNIHKKILEKVEYGCLGDLSNIVILESGRIPNTDEGIFQSTKMYVEDLDLNEEEYLDIWHTSKDMCSVLIVLFSSYGIFDLAKELGVKFLDKLDKVVDYRSTVYNIMESSSKKINTILKIWFLYYQWTSVFKIHRVGIRVGNYQLQKDALACFCGLFASAGKSNYSVSVSHFLGLLAQFPELEKKLQFAASVKMDNDEKRKGHYFAYDEVLETLAAQSERDRVGFLLSEYLDDPCGSNGERAVNQRKEAMWNLVDKLLIAFNNSDNYNIYQNSLWDITSSTNFTPNGLLRLKNCFSDVGRRKLGITRWKPGDSNSKNKKKRKNQELAMPIPQESTMPTSQELMMPTPQDSFEEIPKHKKQRRVTKPSEQQLLKPLINSTDPLTDEQINKVIEDLGSEWNRVRVNQYISRHRKNK